MRKVIEERFWLGSVEIGSIELDAKSRDDFPAVLIGLQAKWSDEAAREELFQLLDARILPSHRRDTSRPGMRLWQIPLERTEAGYELRLRPSSGNSEQARRRAGLPKQ